VTSAASRVGAGRFRSSGSRCLVGMKRLSLAILMFVCALPMQAQEEWQVVLVSGRVFRDVSVEELRGDTVLLVEGRKRVPVDLRDLLRLRRTIGSRAGSGALIGAGVGVGVTLLLAAPFIGSVDSDVWVSTVPMVAVPMGALGGLIGLAFGAADRDEEIHEFSSMPLTERASLIDGIIRRTAVRPGR
jgi:hypothetical protein